MPSAMPPIACCGSYSGSTHIHRWLSAPPRHEPRLARQAAAAGIVVLKNESSVLPLDPATMTRLAVAGPAAARLCPQGGGSAEVTLPYERSPLQAVSARAPGTDVGYEPGCIIPGTVPPLGPSGLRTGNGGAVSRSRTSSPTRTTQR